MIFKNKTVLITGGTGSLGHTLVQRLMSNGNDVPKKIIIFSRDEAKQHAMKLEWANLKIATDNIFYHNYEEILSFRIGDVKDYNSLLDPVKEADIIIHAAALKQVPVCEYFPEESLKTNVLGDVNLIRAIKETDNHVNTVIGISTDKACKPINTYGMCKALQERLLINANLACKKTRFICVRYGNVLASRGSVIPLFQDQIQNGGPVTITTTDMTRFFLNLEKAVDIIFDAIKYAKAGEIYIPIVPSAKIVDLAELMIGNRKNIKIQYTGIRPGEKTHEILISEEELNYTYRNRDYYVIQSNLPELQNVAVKKAVLPSNYSSGNSIMSKAELKKLLKENAFI
jgi:FlaA1/EpsC-like NDP-sugar epimerase